MQEFEDKISLSPSLSFSFSFSVSRPFLCPLELSSSGSSPRLSSRTPPPRSLPNPTPRLPPLSRPPAELQRGRSVANRRPWRRSWIWISFSWIQMRLFWIRNCSDVEVRSVVDGGGDPSISMSFGEEEVLSKKPLHSRPCLFQLPSPPPLLPCYMPPHAFPSPLFFFFFQFLFHPLFLPFPFPFPFLFLFPLPISLSGHLVPNSSSSFLRVRSTSLAGPMTLFFLVFSFSFPRAPLLPPPLSPLPLSW
mmetsp:Transcript_24154/g.43228  ORF Transcript_24154/g.43228 Transcript_24154/m.43228 type:complete len:248 (+) Transcript_24154:102-845(+)